MGIQRFHDLRARLGGQRAGAGWINLELGGRAAGRAGGPAQRLRVDTLEREHSGGGVVVMKGQRLRARDAPLDEGIEHTNEPRKLSAAGLALHCSNESLT